MPDLATNVLYSGDNLDILRRSLPAASVDRVYLGPPFGSNRDDNVIFRDESGNATDAQLLAFEDTWHELMPRNSRSSSVRGTGSAADTDLSGEAEGARRPGVVAETH